ncbi:hypothetical protein M3Y99_01780700 [Aphelenchoides fujianensis]|nr:hypothetical protein M3Y99_01780700 [Aphelenchoides fujianensis]
MVRISWLDQLKGNLNGVWTCFLSFINYFVIALIMRVVSGDYPLWLACLVATLPSLLMCVRQIGVSVGYVQVNLAYFSIRSCLNGMIFDKMLRLSPTVQTKTSSGEIINHMTVDLMRTRIFWLYLKDFFICPSLILVSGSLLARLVGILPASMGLLVLFFL